MKFGEADEIILQTGVYFEELDVPYCCAGVRKLEKR